MVQGGHRKQAPRSGREGIDLVGTAAARKPLQFAFMGSTGVGKCSCVRLMRLMRLVRSGDHFKMAWMGAWSVEALGWACEQESWTDENFHGLSCRSRKQGVDSGCDPVHLRSLCNHGSLSVSTASCKSPLAQAFHKYSVRSTAGTVSGR